MPVCVCGRDWRVSRFGFGFGFGFYVLPRMPHKSQLKRCVISLNYFRPLLRYSSPPPLSRLSLSLCHSILNTRSYLFIYVCCLFCRCDFQIYVIATGVVQRPEKNNRKRRRRKEEVDNRTEKKETLFGCSLVVKLLLLNRFVNLMCHASFMHLNTKFT